MRVTLFDKVGKSSMSVRDAVDVCTAGTKQGMVGLFAQRMRALGNSGKWTSTMYSSLPLAFVAPRMNPRSSISLLGHIVCKLLFVFDIFQT